MIKRIQLAISAVLLAALAVYGFAQNFRQATMPDDSRIALERHETRVIKALKLNAKQQTDYNALQVWVKTESAKLAGMPSGFIERGKEINTEMHARLKRIFTPAQYAKYMDMWAPVDFSGGQGPMATGTPFGGTDEAIFTYLKPTSAQWAEYREFQKENEIKNQQYKQLIKQDQAKGIAFGNEINRWTRSEMKRILGEDKYYEWIRHWDQVMFPIIANGDKHKGQVRTMARPAAGKVGG